LKVLLVEDHRQYADLIQEKLESKFGFDVTVATDPTIAHGYLSAHRYDVVVVDVLYRKLSETYNQKRERARSSLSELQPFNISGLSTLREVTRSPGTAMVVWTSGDPNRTLHLVLAHQTFKVRAFCSKESTYADIGTAISAAAERRPHVDVTLRPFLPRATLPPLGDILFKEIRWRAIWRALAAGSPEHEVTARMTNYEVQTVRKAMAPMAESLAILSPRLTSRRQPLNILSSYATFHWEFFLDRAVVEMFPHTSANSRS
jgi:DNA-binding NarL/FixJ family response regulator